MKTLTSVRFFLLMVLFPMLAMATLGESIDSAAKNLSSARVAQKVSALEKYSVHQYEKNGNTLREYASESGLVFAVGWNGFSKPDLSALFGSYYSEYIEGLNAVPKQYGVKTVSMKTSKMVVRRGSRMRDQKGFAYVPSLVPEGVNIEELQ